jgi:hypothetical protein
VDFWGKDAIFSFAYLFRFGLKPVVGTIDFVSKTTEGIRNTTTMGDKVLGRSRFPRKIGADKVLEVIAKIRVFILKS